MNSDIKELTSEIIELVTNEKSQGWCWYSKKFQWEAT